MTDWSEEPVEELVSKLEREMKRISNLPLGHHYDDRILISRNLFEKLKMTENTDIYDRFLTCLGFEVEPEENVVKPFPDDLDLRIMWQVAVSSSISGQGEAYKIFARLLYQHLTDTGPKIRLDEPITKEQYNESKNQSNP